LLVKDSIEELFKHQDIQQNDCGQLSLNFE